MPAGLSSAWKCPSDTSVLLPLLCCPSPPNPNQVTIPDVTLSDIQASTSPSPSPTPSPSPSPASSTEADQATAASVPTSSDDWDNAPACPSDADASNSVLDNSKRRWGWDKANGRSCKFVDAKDASATDGSGFGAAEAAPEPAAGGDAATAPDWDAAPACQGWPDDKAVSDNSGRMWSTLTDGTSCAYKDSKGAPVVPWDKAPICKVVRASAIVKDDSGNEWAWDTENGRSCAVHRA